MELQAGSAVRRKERVVQYSLLCEIPRTEAGNTDFVYNLKLRNCIRRFSDIRLSVDKEPFWVVVSQESKLKTDKAVVRNPGDTAKKRRVDPEFARRSARW